MIRFTFDESACADLEKALSSEWLETNGLGGYASSTILNCNTRKYHGLLVANLGTSQGRHVLFSWIEDSVSLKKEEFSLSCCQYPCFFFPKERHLLKQFRLDHFPQFTYEVNGIRIRKAIMMIHGEDRVLIRYDIDHCPFPAVLRLKPFFAYRGYHAVAKQNMFLKTKTYNIPQGFEMRPYDGMPPIFIQTNKTSTFHPSFVWYNNFEYDREKERGFEWREDLFLPGFIEVPVKKGSIVIISASLNMGHDKLEKIWTNETTRRSRKTSHITRSADRFENEEDRAHITALIASGLQFMIKSQSRRPTIIAGYHWFVDWGRDTLISLPGLTFCSGFSEEGIDILTSLGAHEKNGLLPNYFADDETDITYNTVDTSLWYFWAVQQMLKYTGKIHIIKNRLWPIMKSILRGYMKGTFYDIHMSDNGLLHAGNKDTQLTWMDATTEGNPVTPRWGYPVEINALWYNAVCFAHELTQRFDDHEFSFHTLIPGMKKSFIDTFWIEGEAYLGDVFCNGCLDRAIRPNQILAVSLPYSPLSPPQWTGVVEKVRQRLLTPVGLRTLSPEDSHYKGRYGGDGLSRDSAYHQGTVWPWLLGHFGEAYLRAAQNKLAAKRFLLHHLRSFIRRHMQEAGVGCISEIFDGNPPHRPNGCISQAWSAAELIRLYTLLNEIPDS